MQKLFISIILVLYSFAALAQNKPSKEETIKFMVSVIKDMKYVEKMNSGYPKSLISFIYGGIN